MQCPVVSVSHLISPHGDQFRYFFVPLSFTFFFPHSDLNWTQKKVTKQFAIPPEAIPQGMPIYWGRPGDKVIQVWKCRPKFPGDAPGDLTSVKRAFHVHVVFTQYTCVYKHCVSHMYGCAYHVHCVHVRTCNFNLLFRSIEPFLSSHNYQSGNKHCMETLVLILCHCNSDFSKWLPVNMHAYMYFT